MPGTSSPRRDDLRHVEWLPLFADRDGPRAQIDLLLHKLSSNLDKPEFPLSQFYGLSGQGKSALYLKIQEYAPKRFPNIRFAFVDLEQMDPTRITNPIEVLWQITDALASAGIVAPLTLCLYAHYWKKQNVGQEFRPNLIFKDDFLERCIRGCEILSPFKDLLQTMSDIGQASFKTVAVFQKFWRAALERRRELRIADFRGSDPGEWDLAQIDGSFPEFLALDVLDHLTSHPADRVFIAVDTFERLEPGSGNDASERAFQELCGRLVAASGDTFGRSGILLFGREQLRWERYDELHTQDPWAPYIQTQELNGFTESHAMAFLRNEYSEFWKARGAGEISARLQEYESAILNASEEKLGQAGALTFLPYYLRLAGEMIYIQGDRFAPEMLGHSPDEMQQRFLKYLKDRSPEKCRAMQVLALALHFDDDLFQYLVSHHFIQQIPIQGLVSELLANRSYVRRFDDGGRTTYRFHRHMQQTLLDDLENEPEAVEAATKAIDGILRYYAGRSTFATPAEFKIETHLSAYEHGMDVLLTFTEREWIRADRANEWFWRFEEPFDEYIATATRARVFERALPTWARSFGNDHTTIARNLNYLALLYLHQGRYAEAEPLLQRAISIREKSLVPGHAETAASLNNLANLYGYQGRYTEAEPLFQHAIGILEKALGFGHPETAASLNNLAENHRRQGRYAEAETLFRDALTIRREVLGPSHPDTAATLNTLVQLYYKQGRYAEGEPLAQHALAICETALGADHPNTAISLVGLATLYHSQGKYAEAEPLIQRAVAIYEKVLGPDHPDTATSLNNLAEFYRNQGRYFEAEPLFQRAIAICEKALGADHPDTARSLNNLALLYHSQGRYFEAEPLFQRAIAIWEDVLGPVHPDTARSLNNLALVYCSQGHYAKAEPLFQRTLAIYEEALGNDHPDIAMSLNNLAEFYRSQDRYAEAEPLYHRAVAIYEETLGVDHPDTARSLNNLALMYHSQGRNAKAEPLFQRALAIWEETLGPNHPDTALGLNNLALLYHSQGRYAKAEPLFQRALAIWEETLGTDHPNVATVRENYAMLLDDTGRHAKARFLRDSA